MVRLILFLCCIFIWMGPKPFNSWQKMVHGKTFFQQFLQL
jgi:hypothetical protein